MARLNLVMYHHESEQIKTSGHRTSRCIAIPDAVVSALASDVEYRIHQVIEVLVKLYFGVCKSDKEAARFMRHGRRTMMTTSDIDQALRVLTPLRTLTPLSTHRRSEERSHFRECRPQGQSTS
jgi:transcription initiation factor TFIID subunit 6